MAQEAQRRTLALAVPTSHNTAAEPSARTLPSPPPPFDLPAAAKVPNDHSVHISLHIQSASQRENAQRLANRLQQSGYITPDSAIVVSKGPPRTEVRYFHPTAAEEAAAIAMLLHQPYRSPATLIYKRGRKEAAQSTHRRYEVWLGPEPRSPNTAH
jgi:hypothetical protein